MYEALAKPKFRYELQKCFTLSVWIPWEYAEWFPWGKEVQDRFLFLSWPWWLFLMPFVIPDWVRAQVVVYPKDDACGPERSEEPSFIKLNTLWKWSCFHCKTCHEINECGRANYSEKSFTLRQISSRIFMKFLKKCTWILQSLQSWWGLQN